MILTSLWNKQAGKQIVKNIYSVPAKGLALLYWKDSDNNHIN